MTFVLHGGFHKTATTHIQKTLESQSTVLADNGVLVAPHVALRKHYTKTTNDLIFGRKNTQIDNGGEAQSKIEGLFDDLRFGGAERLIFSEENFIGHVGQVAYLGDFYQGPRKFLSQFRGQLPMMPTKVLLSVRNYADFFASCYVEHIGSAPADRFVTPDIMAAKVLGNMPNWSRVIDMFAETFSEAEIVLWRYEDFRANYDTVMQEFVGSDAYPAYLDAVGVAARETRARKSVGAITMQRFLDRIALDGVETALMRWRDIKDECAPLEDGRPFNPWTAQQRNHLDSLYRDDWEKITQDERFRIIS